MSQGMPSLTATCWVPTDICGGAESQGIVRRRLAEFIRSIRPRFGYVKGGLCTGRACEGKIALFLESHNLICLIYSQMPEINKAELPEIGRVGLVDLL